MEKILRKKPLGQTEKENLGTIIIAFHYIHQSQIMTLMKKNLEIHWISTPDTEDVDQDNSYKDLLESFQDDFGRPIDPKLCRSFRKSLGQG